MHYGYIGLGNLGGHLAASLIGAGFTVTVHDKDRTAAERLLALGAELVPTTFELMCGAALMAAQVLRTPAAILLKFAGRFSLMFHVYAGAAIGELALLVALYRAGHGGHALAALVIASIVSSLIIVAHGWPLLRSCRPVRARG